ncbi:MAG: peptidoglycan-binding domain-containing protein [Verrucomicrobiota bacterium]
MGGSPYFYGYPYGYPYPYGAYPAPSYDSGVAAGYPYGYAPASAACAEMLPPPVAEGVNGCPVPVAGDLVGNVQRALKYRGFYPGPIDGLSGPATRAAVRAYDASVGLPATGMIDARLLTSLGIL